MPCMSALTALDQPSPITLAALQSHNAEDIPVSRLLAATTNRTRKHSKPSTFSANWVHFQGVLNNFHVTFLSCFIFFYLPGTASTVFAALQIHWDARSLRCPKFWSIVSHNCIWCISLTPSSWPLMNTWGRYPFANLGVPSLSFRSRSCSRDKDTSLSSYLKNWME